MDIRASMPNLITVLIIAVTAALISQFHHHFPHNLFTNESTNYHDRVIPSCPPEHFRLPSMTSCHPCLTCQDFVDVKIGNKIAEGLVKRVLRSTWRGHDIVVSQLKDQALKDDFDHNVQMLRTFSPSGYVAKYVGSCKHLLITQYYEHGSALNFRTVLRSTKTTLSDTQIPFDKCFNFCLSYIRVIEFLHNSPLGVRVMCDSNTLPKLLSQFLITEQLELIANDLDALPEVRAPSSGVLCGHREVTGPFAAPEQLWQHSSDHEIPFDEAKMALYDEKTDLWKVPDVCEWFLMSCEDDVSVREALSRIHGSCKTREPHLRPSARQVRLAYESLRED